MLLQKKLCYLEMSSSSSSESSDSSSSSGEEDVSVVTGTSTTTTAVTGTSSVSNTSGTATTTTTTTSGTEVTTTSGTTPSDTTNSNNQQTSSALGRQRIVQFQTGVAESSDSSVSEDSETTTTATSSATATTTTGTSTTTGTTATASKANANVVQVPATVPLTKPIADSSSDSDTDSSSSSESSANPSGTTTTATTTTTTTTTTTDGTTTTTTSSFPERKAVALPTRRNENKIEIKQAGNENKIEIKQGVQITNAELQQIQPEPKQPKPLRIGEPIQNQPIEPTPPIPVRVEPQENLRYVDGTDSTDTTSTSDDTGSTIDDQMNTEVTASPTVIVKTFRESQMISLGTENEVRPTWPSELTIPRGSSRDIVKKLCESVAAEDLTRISRANVFVACKALLRSDSDCATALWGLDESLSFDTFSNIVENESVRAVDERVSTAFKLLDKYCTGELSRVVVEELLEVLGICHTNLSHIATDVALSRNGIAKICQTLDGRKVETAVEVDPRKFQMFVDNVRGEVTCNGVAVCSRISASSLGEIVQALQLCVFVTSLVDANFESSERIVYYEPLLQSLLTPQGQQSLVRMNVLNHCIHPLRNVEESFRTKTIEPFLNRAADRRAPSMMPLEAQNQPIVDARFVTSLTVREVCLVHEIPTDAVRYVLLSTISSTNSIYPSVKISPKQPNDDSRTWLFSKKSVNNTILICGNPSDVVYVEVCYDIANDNDNERTKSHCVGFATCTLSNLKSGTLMIKEGTYFRPNDTAVSEDTSCFCFAAKPATRIVIETRKQDWDDHRNLIQGQRVVILQRHANILAVIRRYLSQVIESSSSSRGLRWQISDAIFQLNEGRGDSLDSLAKIWDSTEKRLSSEQRNDIEVFAQIVARQLVESKLINHCTEGNEVQFPFSLANSIRPLSI